MKKILVIMAVLASMQFAGAQSPKAVNAEKKVKSAIATTENPKKASKAKTWLKLGDAYMEAFNAPAGDVWIGASKAELKLIIGDQKVQSTDQVVVSGQQMIKESYADKDLYFNPNGQVVIVDVTKPVVENALGKAFDAYKKAFEIDSRKGSDVKKAFELLDQKYNEQAFNAYSLGDMKEANFNFGKAVEAAGEAPLSKIDTNALYNQAFTAWMIQDWKQSLDCFEKCVAVGYYGEEGEAFAKLGDVATHLENNDAAITYLEEGFKMFPQSQSILIGLINYYVSSKSNTSRLFELLDEAKKNEPNNASLYYVEGNIHKQLGQNEEALASYKECATIDPNYEFGYIGAGILYYEMAIEIQTKMQEELDDAKFMKLNEEFEKDLKACIEPFEKAYKISKSNDVKVSVAEYLKNACFRFSEDAKYLDAYKKYNKVVETGQAD